MVTVLKPGTSVRQRDNLIAWFESQGMIVHVSEGQTHTVLGIVGDTTQIDIELLQSLDIVDSAKRVLETYKCANRKFHPQDSVISIGEHKIGGGNFQMIAGPCSIESEEPLSTSAHSLHGSGATLLRCGAF